MSDQLTVTLDTKRCKSYGICVGILPEVFDTPPGAPVAVLLRDTVDADEREDLEEAIRACPAQAIAMGSDQHA